MGSQNPDTFNSKNLCKVLLEYKKSILIILSISAVMAVLFSSPIFITPLFKSTTIIYPTSSNSISKALLSTTHQSENDILEFGEDQQTEQMLQVLNSNRVRDKVIEKFNLMEHYKISLNQKHPYTRLNKLYDSRIKFHRTEFNAVEIIVLDQDPVLAAQVANEIAEIFDSTMNTLQKEVAIKAFEIVEKEYTNLKNEMNLLEDSLNVLRKLGVFDYEAQVEMLSQQLAIELGHGNNKGANAIQEKLDILAEYGGASFAIQEMLEHDRLQLSLIKTKYEEAKVDATQNIPHKFIVTSAFVAEQKSQPIRWIIVVATVISTFIILLFAIVLIEKYGNATRMEKENVIKGKPTSTGTEK
jgi:Chain length determinant protein.